MKNQVFINLPVADLKRSMDFYARTGFTNNPQFTDETAACMVFSEEIYVMLLTHKKFNEFTNKTISDSKSNVEVINTISVNSREEVDKYVGNAIAAGGEEPTAARDYGFMWQRSFEDPDGHIWEFIYMDMTKFPQQ